MHNGIWISWEIQRRNKGIAEHLKWPLYEIDIKKTRIQRYLESLSQTFSIIRHNKPRVVVAQNPSIVLAIWMTLLAPFLRFSFVMDAHNGGLRPQEGKNPLLLAIARWLQRQARYTIVTNPDLKTVVDKQGGRALCLPDALPIIQKHDPLPLDGTFKVVFICTYSADEPYSEVIAAAAELPQHYRVYITGKYAGKVDPAKVPATVRLLGFVPDKDFFGLLAAADAIMDLTTRENCLVCGAYEGVSMHKPLILSNTKALRTYFYKGCTYVNPNAASIKDGILDAAQRIELLKSDVTLLEAEIQTSWNKDFAAFKEALEPLLNKPSAKSTQ